MACNSAAAIIYYLLAFTGVPNRIGGTHAGLPAQSAGAVGRHGRSIMTYAGVRPELFEADAHNPQYGYRRQVKVVIDDMHPSFLYWLFGGSDRTHWRALGVSATWDWVLGRS